MEWWTDLWLNEGFATWVGWLAVDNVFPQWRVWDQFLIAEQARGLELDGLRSSHPIEARCCAILFGSKLLTSNGHDLRVLVKVGSRALSRPVPEAVVFRALHASCAG